MSKKSKSNEQVGKGNKTPEQLAAEMESSVTPEDLSEEKALSQQAEAAEVEQEIRAGQNEVEPGDVEDESDTYGPESTEENTQADVDTDPENVTAGETTEKLFLRGHPIGDKVGSTSKKGYCVRSQADGNDVFKFIGSVEFEATYTKVDGSRNQYKRL